MKYRIAGKSSEDFNLAVWRIVKNRLIKFSPIIKHDVICNTHAHRLSTLQCAPYLRVSVRVGWSRAGFETRSGVPETNGLQQRFCASQLQHKEPLFVLSCTQFNSSVRKTFMFSLIDIVHCALNNY